MRELKQSLAILFTDPGPFEQMSIVIEADPVLIRIPDYSLLSTFIHFIFPKKERKKNRRASNKKKKKRTTTTATFTNPKFSGKTILLGSNQRYQERERERFNEAPL